MSSMHPVQLRLFSHEDTDTDSASATASVSDLRPKFLAAPARLFESAQLRYRWIAATLELTTDFLAATDPDAVLCRVVGRACEL